MKVSKMFFFFKFNKQYSELLSIFEVSLAVVIYHFTYLQGDYISLSALNSYLYVCINK